MNINDKNSVFVDFHQNVFFCCRASVALAKIDFLCFWINLQRLYPGM